MFLPGESCGQRSLVGCCPWGRTESDVTEATQQQQQQCIYVNPSPPVPPTHLPLPCPHVCSLHLCLYSCPASRFVCTIFLDSTYMHWYMVFFSFLRTSLCLTVSRSIHKWPNSIPFTGWVIFHCVRSGAKNYTHRHLWLDIGDAWQI